MKRDNKVDILGTEIFKVFEEIKKKNGKFSIGVLVIPITKKNPPVLVFKAYRGPLQRIKYYYAPGTIQVEQKDVEGFVSYWNSKFTENKLPFIVNQAYPAFSAMSKLKGNVEEMPKTRRTPNGKGLIIPVTKLWGRYDAVKNTIRSYDPDDLPKGCFELKLSGILNPALWPKESNIERKRYKSVREIFKQFNLIPEVRGKNKKVDTKKMRRDTEIIKLYKEIVETKRPKLRPIKEIYDNLNPEFGDPSFVTIRRVLKKNNY